MVENIKWWRDNQVYVNQIETKDNLGGKMKLTYTGGQYKLVCTSSSSRISCKWWCRFTQTFTGWRLKDSGSGNQYNFLTGLTYNVGKLQIAPNFLWQKPLEGPITTDVPAPGRPRNILDDPFVVRANREQVAGELLLLMIQLLAHGCMTGIMINLKIQNLQ